MEQITKNLKLIGGILLVISAILPFATVGFFGFSASLSGFDLFSVGKLGGMGFLALLAILLILAGAAALIYVDVTKKDITLAPKFTLSYVAKLAAVVGGGLVFLWVLTASGVGFGFGLILEIIIAVALLFEEKIVAALKK
jgi:hypothetical protein